VIASPVARIVGRVFVSSMGTLVHSSVEDRWRLSPSHGLHGAEHRGRMPG